jgi:hypothetical protein
VPFYLSDWLSASAVETSAADLGTWLDTCEGSICLSCN